MCLRSAFKLAEEHTDVIVHFTIFAAQMLDQLDRMDHRTVVTPAELATDFRIAARSHYFCQIHRNLPWPGNGPRAAFR